VGGWGGGVPGRAQLLSRSFRWPRNPAATKLQEHEQNSFSARFNGIFFDWPYF